MAAPATTVRLPLSVLAAIIALFPTRAVRAQEPLNQQSPIALATVNADPEKQRQAMLRWIDDELSQHVLYRPDDIDSLHLHVEELAPASLDAFVKQTATMRDLMRSPEWLLANKFFRYYRTLDPVLDDEQRAELAAGVATLSPQDVVRLMRTLIEQRENRLYLHQASQMQNQILVGTRSSIIADQDRMRRYALEQASTRNLRNYFPAHQASIAVRRTQYRVPGPLITSRDMARWVVFSGFFGRRF